MFFETIILVEEFKIAAPTKNCTRKRRFKKTLYLPQPLCSVIEEHNYVKDMLATRFIDVMSVARES